MHPSASNSTLGSWKIICKCICVCQTHNFSETFSKLHWNQFHAGIQQRGLQQTVCPPDSDYWSAVLIRSRFKDQMSKKLAVFNYGLQRGNSSDWEDISCWSEDNLSHVQDDTFSKSLWQMCPHICSPPFKSSTDSECKRSGDWQRGTKICRHRNTSERDRSKEEENELWLPNLHASRVVHWSG